MSEDLLDWADVVMVMERRQKTILQERFAASVSNKRLVVLGVPDRFDSMQPELIAILKKKCLPLLTRNTYVGGIRA